MEIIYCAHPHERLYKAAQERGFLLGCQLPSTALRKHNKFSIHFADQDWKAWKKAKEADKKDGGNRIVEHRSRYMDELKLFRPKVATVLDLEFPEQFEEVVSWAEEASQYVETVIIIPKYAGAISQIESRFPDRKINGASIRLGYSVPTSFGGTKVHKSEFGDWPIHLLGGSPEKQMKLSKIMNVVSVDSNMILKFANRCMVWVSKDLMGCRASTVPLKSLIEFQADGAYFRAFELSATNVMAAWEEFLKGDNSQTAIGSWCNVT